MGSSVIVCTYNRSKLLEARLLNSGYLIPTKDIRSAIAQYSGSSQKNSKEYHNGEPVKSVSVRQENSELIISLKYAVDFDLFYPGLGFVISDYSGSRICGTSVMVDDVKVERIARRGGDIKIILKQPKLFNGWYKLSIWFGDGLKDFFVDKDCLEFEVVNMASLRQKSISANGPVYPVCEWFIPHSAPYEPNR